jgi:hypothetical protein
MDINSLLNNETKANKAPHRLSISEIGFSNREVDEHSETYSKDDESVDHFHNSTRNSIASEELLQTTFSDIIKTNSHKLERGVPLPLHYNSENTSLFPSPVLSSNSLHMSSAAFSIGKDSIPGYGTFRPPAAHTYSEAETPRNIPRARSLVDNSSNDSNKRKRRKYFEITRVFKCDFEGCEKSYGTLNHLNHHKRLKKH